MDIAADDMNWTMMTLKSKVYGYILLAILGNIIARCWISFERNFDLLFLYFINLIINNVFLFAT